MLDQFTVDAVRNAKKYGRERVRYYWEYYTSLARQRTEKSDEIKRCLLSAAEVPSPLKRWQRVVDYRYSLHPLSAVGSLITDPGGRFNIGDIDRTQFPPFPALYLAADQSTAIVERFGEIEAPAGLSNLDFALRSGPSFSCVSVSGCLDSVVDLRHRERLRSFVDIIKTFKLPTDLAAHARELGIDPPSVIGSVDELISALTRPGWREEPMQVDIPAASQIFGQLVWSAGIEGIVFPSSRSGAACVAIFPENLSSSSFAELDDKAPAGVTHLRLDGTTYRDFVR